jgi:Protein of unknown function (DUF1501)
VIGASDARGEDVADRPVYPRDLLGSMYELMGIEASAKLPNPQGLDLRVLASGKDVPSGGLLKEIM